MSSSGGSAPAFIGIDVGTSSVKAIMGREGGILLERYGAQYQTRRPAPGAVEQDPADWMRHVDAALARFAAHPDAGEVVAIGVTSQVNTHVFCDADFAPLHPAITWQDTRPAARAARRPVSTQLPRKLPSRERRPWIPPPPLFRRFCFG